MLRIGFLCVAVDHDDATMASINSLPGPKKGRAGSELPDCELGKHDPLPHSLPSHSSEMTVRTVCLSLFVCFVWVFVCANVVFCLCACV